MTSITVIGVGSPYGADNIAWQVIDSLKQDHALQTLCNERVLFIQCDRPGAALIDYMRGKDYVIVIDALLGGIPGDIHEYSTQQLLELFAEQSMGMSSHEFGIVDSIRLADKLDALPNRLIVITINIGTHNRETIFTAKQLHDLNNNINNRILRVIQSENGMPATPVV